MLSISMPPSTNDPMSLTFITQDHPSDSSNTHNLSTRSPYRPHNYCRIWESVSKLTWMSTFLFISFQPPPRVDSPQNVCHPHHSKIVQKDSNRKDVSSDTVLKTLPNTDDLIPLSDNFTPTILLAESTDSEDVDHPASPSPSLTPSRKRRTCAIGISYVESSSEDSLGSESSQAKLSRTCMDATGGHTCTVCNRTFSRALQLQRHITSRGHMAKVENRAKYGVDKVKCSRCSFSSESPEAVVIHYVYDHSNRPETKLCTQNLVTADVVVDQFHGSTSVPEDIESDSLIALKDPIKPRTSHSIKPATSLYSNNTSASICADDQRPRAFTLNAPSTCPNSKVETKQPISRPSLHPRPVIKQDILLKSKRRRDYRKFPVVDCDGVLRYACDVCKFTLNRPSDLARHFRSNKHRAACGEPPFQYECPHCNGGFSRTDALRRHMTRICG